MSDSGEQWAIGERLHAAGWRQGTLFHSPSVRFTLNDAERSGSDSQIVAVEQDIETDHFVIITQECDIVSRDEGHVEALAVRQDAVRATSVFPGSGRWFVLSRQQRLVADGRYRVAISKEALELLEPEAWPWGSEWLRRFKVWLGHRYMRPALHDHVVNVFQDPVRRALGDALRKRSPAVQAFNEVVGDLRIQYGPVDRPPLHVRLLVVIMSDSLTEEQDRAIKETLEIIKSAANPEAVRLEHTIRTGLELSIAEYFAHEPLDLERMSVKGQDVIGAEGYGVGRVPAPEVPGDDGD